MNPENLKQKIADRILFSEDGVKIDEGETYYEGEIHGRKTNFTLSQGESFIGFRDFSTDQRKKLAKSGKAMPDGSFPIENCEDAKNAIFSQGRARQQAAVVAHIKKRVKALGCKGSTFDNYK